MLVLPLPPIPWQRPEGRACLNGACGRAGIGYDRVTDI